MSAFLAAIEQARQDGYNHPARLIRSGYEPTPEEWDAYESLAVGSEFQTHTLGRRLLHAKAFNYWKSIKRVNGKLVPREERIRMVTERYDLLKTAVLHYCYHQRDQEVVELAERIGSGLPTIFKED